MITEWNILACQIISLRWTSLGYNSGWQGFFLSFSSGSGWRTDTMPFYFRLFRLSVANIAL